MALSFVPGTQSAMIIRVTVTIPESIGSQKDVLPSLEGGHMLHSLSTVTPPHPRHPKSASRVLEEVSVPPLPHSLSAKPLASHDLSSVCCEL